MVQGRYTSRRRMTGREEPEVQVVIRGMGTRFFGFSEFARTGDDPATISDTKLKDRVAEWMDINTSLLARHVVSRPSTGNILVSPPPTFG